MMIGVSVFVLILPDRQEGEYLKHITYSIFKLIDQVECVPSITCIFQCVLDDLT